MARWEIYCILLLSLQAYAIDNHNAITKDIGLISFYERNWQLIYALDLKTYVENALILRNTTKGISDLCDIMPNEQNCKYFQQNIEANVEIAQKEITQHRRVRRGFWGMLIREVVREVCILAGAVYIVDMLEENRIDRLEDELEKTNERLKKMYNVDTLQNGIIVTNANNTMKLQRDLMKLNETITNRENLNQLIHIATQTLVNHNRNTLKFINIIKGDFRANFFNIVDLRVFMDNITTISQSLGENGYLASSNPFEILNLSELAHSENATHI